MGHRIGHGRQVLSPGGSSLLRKSDPRPQLLQAAIPPADPEASAPPSLPLQGRFRLVTKETPGWLHPRGLGEGLHWPLELSSFAGVSEVKVGMRGGE